jgi:SulP family sulfate permease
MGKVEWFLKSLFSKEQWFSNIRGDVLAGITITLALIPDAIAFSFIAGVNPMIGLFSTVIIMIVISFCGSRPAMVSSAAGSMAVLMAPLVLMHGVQYLFAATILTGIIQFLMGVCKTGKWMNFVPGAVVTGFINALAILILMDQLRHLVKADWLMLTAVAVTLVIVYLLPRLTKAIPSPLVAVTLVTIASFSMGLPLETIGSQVLIDNTLPLPGLPDIPFTWQTLVIILPFALSLSLVGYTETLLTQNMIDEKTGEKTDKNGEMKGQGTANAITGLFGGMAGCALVAESVIHVKIGARGRLSTLTGGLVLLALILLFGKVVNVIPVAALVGVMLMICFEIFDWGYLLKLRSKPVSETVIMIATVATSIYTHNLAIGALVGVLLSMAVFVYKLSRIQIKQETIEGEKVYRVKGALFFASATELQDAIHLNDTITNICLDFREAHLWDRTSRLSIINIRRKLRERGYKVRVIGLQLKGESRS